MSEAFNPIPRVGGFRPAGRFASTLALVAALCCAVSQAGADVVSMADGREFEGEIVTQDETA